jgi:hypothetical protein
VSVEERLTDVERKLAEVTAEREALRAENERLQRELEAWRRGLRERGKRRSSRPEKKRATERKRSGRKGGHTGVRRAPSTHVDRDEHHPMPACCLGCWAGVVATGEEATALELDVLPIVSVVTRHRTPIGRCGRCGKRVVARLPGAAPQGATIASVTLGPNVVAMALSLRFEAHVPLAKVGAFLGTWMGVAVGASGLSPLVMRLCRRSLPSYGELEAHVRASAVVGIDERGLWQHGVRGDW